MENFAIWNHLCCTKGRWWCLKLWRDHLASCVEHECECVSVCFIGTFGFTASSFHFFSFSINSQENFQLKRIVFILFTSSTLDSIFLPSYFFFVYLHFSLLLFLFVRPRIAFRVFSAIHYATVLCSCVCFLHSANLVSYYESTLDFTNEKCSYNTINTLHIFMCNINLNYRLALFGSPAVIQRSVVVIQNA